MMVFWQKITRKHKKNLVSGTKCYYLLLLHNNRVHIQLICRFFLREYMYLEQWHQIFSWSFKTIILPLAPKYIGSPKCIQNTGYNQFQMRDHIPMQSLFRYFYIADSSIIIMAKKLAKKGFKKINVVFLFFFTPLPSTDFNVNPEAVDSIPCLLVSALQTYHRLTVDVSHFLATTTVTNSNVSTNVSRHTSSLNLKDLGKIDKQLLGDLFS